MGKIYSMNEGNYGLWDEPTKKYTDSLKDPSLWGGKPYSARYIGSLVSTVQPRRGTGGSKGTPQQLALVLLVSAPELYVQCSEYSHIF